MREPFARNVIGRIPAGIAQGLAATSRSIMGDHSNHPGHCLPGTILLMSQTFSADARFAEPREAKDCGLLPITWKPPKYV